MNLTADDIKKGKVTYIKNEKTQELIKQVTFDKPLTVTENIDIKVKLEERNMYLNEIARINDRLAELEKDINTYNNASIKEDIKEDIK
jgi:hypothetical protein